MSKRHDLFWADFFGITSATLCTPGLSVVSHVGLAGYRGVWFFLRGARLVVSAPAAWLGRISRVLARSPGPPGLPAQATLVELFGSNLERTIGPAFHGSLEARHFRASTSAQVRTVTEADSDAVTDFRNACGADAWTTSALGEAQSFRAGYFDNSRIVSIAGFRSRNAGAGDPCVLTLPDHRARGYGTAVVSAVLEAVIARAQVPLYQTLESNVAAVRIALQLGFTRYAKSHRGSPGGG